MPILRQSRVATPTPAQRRPISPMLSDPLSVHDSKDLDSSSAHEKEEMKPVDPVGLSRLVPPQFYKSSKHRLLTDLARARDGEACLFHPSEFAVWAAYCRLCGSVKLCSCCTDHLKRIGWVRASEGKNWIDGIFGFLDEDGKRLIGIEYDLIMDGGSQKVKGIWNCILKKDEDGKILYDGGMMDGKCKGFLEGGENFLSRELYRPIY